MVYLCKAPSGATVEVHEGANRLIVGLSSALQEEVLYRLLDSAVAHLGLHAGYSNLRLHLHALQCLIVGLGRNE